MRKKTIFAILVITLTLITIGVFRFVIGGSEDKWVCENDEWEKHGNPKNPAPSYGCGKTVLEKTRESNFNKTGNLTQNNGKWSLVYEEPGSPGLSVELVFNDDSIGDISMLEVGARVSVEGNRVDNEVEVYKITVLN